MHVTVSPPTPRPQGPQAPGPAAQQAAAAAALVSLLASASPALAATDYQTPPLPTLTNVERPGTAPSTTSLSPGDAQSAPPLYGTEVKKADQGLPEGTQWRYSDFINAVESGKIERVRFSKDGTQLQLTAIDGRRALVNAVNDPELVDRLAKNGVDISVSEGEQQVCVCVGVGGHQRVMCCAENVWRG